NDFVITRGRCLVEGWDVLNESDICYTSQPLYNLQPGAATLHDTWGVELLPDLEPPDSGIRTDLVYLDVWEREVDDREDESLVNPAIGVPTCVRFKREWTVRVAKGASPEFLLYPTDRQPGHAYYQLASITRRPKSAIEEGDIKLVRHTVLNL